MNSLQFSSKSDLIGALASAPRNEAFKPHLVL
jgi:hypothetical protein